MIKIGITGGIGSGKTTICQIFEVLGIPVFYADDAAKKLMQSDEELVAQLTEAFGKDTYVNGILNRSYIAALVFNNPVQLTKLNSLVHPAVFRAFDTWAGRQSTPYLIKEAALLFESGSDKLCDKTIVVTAPVELRISRVLARDQVEVADVEKRMKQQLDDTEKLALADFVLVNDETRLIIPQVLQLHETFLQLSTE